MKKPLNKSDIIIFLLAILLFFSALNLDRLVKPIKDPRYEEKIQASLLMKDFLEAIKNEKISRGIIIDKRYDINETGIIGEEFNGITTTLGSLESKRTSSNPNFAAVMVDLFYQAGLGEGDKVALNFSGSFPAINLATLAACEVLKIEPIIISSIGSSTWGANNLDYIYIDMEDYLFNEGYINYKSKAISIGGASDLGKDMDKDVLEPILKRMEALDKRIIYEEDLETNINTRYEIYLEDYHTVDGFVNIGGNIVSFGNTMDSNRINYGLIKDKIFESNSKTGLVQLFNTKGIPVIHILNIKGIALEYGLEVDLQTEYKIGDGGVYFRLDYPRGLILGLILFAILILFIYRWKTRVTYD